MQNRDKAAKRAESRFRSSGVKILSSHAIYCNNYEVDLAPLFERLRVTKPRKVLVHAPNGLKHLYNCIGPLLSEKGLSIYYSSSPGYGACDIPLEEADLVNADLIVHIGHAKYPLVDVKDERVVYVPAHYTLKPPERLLEELYRVLAETGAKALTVSSTLVEKYVRSLVASYLRERGLRVIEVTEPILGCYYVPVLLHEHLVDAHVVVAGGIFHSLGLALSARKRVIAVDPYMNKVWTASTEAEKVVKKRLYAIFKAKSAAKGLVGIIVGTRPGQYRPQLVEYIENLARSRGYKTLRITSNYLTLETLSAIDSALDLDFYVVTSCPRLPIDDLADFHKPVLTPGELIMLVAERPDYVFPW
ncbi:MAG: diphthamide biosynthesis enzyme Dph2 [Desulfurococcaceae archaeon]